jgi:phosphoserine phosphatase
MEKYLVGEGLKNICRLYGQMRIGDVLWVWDYAADKPVREDEMRRGTDRWYASEAARGEWLRKRAVSAGAEPK